MISAKHKQQRDERTKKRPEPSGDTLTLDPDFDELHAANVEWCRWRFPERDHD